MSRWLAHLPHPRGSDRKRPVSVGRVFAYLGRVVSRRPWFVIAAWLVIAVAVIATAPKLSSTTDEAGFLPSHYESIQALNIQQEAFPQKTDIGAILVFDRVDGAPLTTSDSADVERITTELGKNEYPAFASITAGQLSQNKLVQTAVATMKPGAQAFDNPAMDSVKQLRADAKPLVAPTDLRLGVTGAAAQALDSQEASSNAEAIVGIATVLLIIVLLSLIFRSVIIAVLPIVVVGLVSQVAVGFIAWANQAFGLQADSSIQVILIVVLFGIGTDYILFFLFRYRERLRLGEESKTSVAQAVTRAGEAIASAGGAVIVAFMALLLSSLSVFRSIGPALAIAVTVTVLAALTLVPAIVSLIGTRVFWPSKAWRREPKSAHFGAIGTALAARPALFAVTSGLILAILSLFAFGFKPTFDLASTGAPSSAESTIALITLEKGLPAGATDPTTIYVQSDSGAQLDAQALDEFGHTMAGAPGIAQVSPPTLSSDGSTAVFTVLLSNDPASDQALADVAGPIRTTAHASAPAGTTAYVGGTTSVYVDLKSAMRRDYVVVFSVAALLIMVILGLLLRSLVAPWYLMISVGLGFGATLGASVIVFQHIRGENGLVFLLPIYIYLFVVALGTDYNILMIARLREEAREGKDPREAASMAVKHAGPTVTSAGLILGGTFASLILAGNQLLSSLGFAISFGILVAAFVMALFFTPALTALIGHAAWWPGHEDETQPSGS